MCVNPSNLVLYTRPLGALPTLRSDGSPSMDLFPFTSHGLYAKGLAMFVMLGILDLPDQSKYNSRKNKIFAYYVKQQK